MIVERTLMILFFRTIFYLLQDGCIYIYIYTCMGFIYTDISTYAHACTHIYMYMICV